MIVIPMSDLCLGEIGIVCNYGDGSISYYDGIMVIRVQDDMWVQLNVAKPSACDSTGAKYHKVIRLGYNDIFFQAKMN